MKSQSHGGTRKGAGRKPSPNPLKPILVKVLPHLLAWMRHNRKTNGTQQKFQQGFQQGLGQAQQQMQGAQNLTRQANESDADYEARVSKQQVDASKLGEGLRSAEYKGPQGLENYQALQNRATGVSQMSDLARSNIGQGLLAKQAIAAPGRYTRGQSALDQLLIGQDTAAQQAIRQARQNISGVAQKAEEATRIAQEAGQGAAEGLQKTKADIAQKLQKELQGIQTRGTEAAAKFNKDAQALSDYLRTFDPTKQRAAETPEQKAQNQYLAGLIKNASQYGLDLGKYKNIYMEDPGQAQAYVNAILANPELSAGGQKFTEQQKGTGNILGQLLQDTDTARKIQESKFNTDVFKADESAASFLEPLAAERQIDQNKRKLIQNYLDAGSKPFGQGDVRGTQRALMDAGLWNDVNKEMRNLVYQKTGASNLNWKDPATKAIQLEAIRNIMNRQVSSSSNLEDMLKNMVYQNMLQPVIQNKIMMKL